MFYRGRFTQTPTSVSPPTCSSVKGVIKKVENNLTKNEVNLPNHINLMWQVDYTFSGGILRQAVFGGDTNHGSKLPLGQLVNGKFQPVPAFGGA